MRTTTNFLISLLLMGLFIVLAVSCKKDDEEKGTFTDSRDGTVYQTITIGNQVWMAENLKYLPSVVGPGTGSATTPYYYVYGYEGTDVNAAKATNNYQTFGVLYNWKAALSACPDGWHLPSDAEWTQLTDYLGGKSVAGGKLKKNGFTALPGGTRSISGYFSDIGTSGYWWSATEDGATDAWNRGMYYDYSGVDRGYRDKGCGFSVRCVRD